MTPPQGPAVWSQGGNCKIKVAPMARLCRAMPEVDSREKAMAMLFLKKSKAQGNKKGFSLSAHHRGEWDWGKNADWQLMSETSMARHLKHKSWVFKLFRALQKHYGSPSNRVNSTLILVKDFWLEKMKCTYNFWALSCTPFPKVFLCFSLEQMFVTPKISLRRLTRGELDFPEVGDLLTGPQGSSAHEPLSGPFRRLLP